MSAPLSREEVLHLQRLYACAGFYTGRLDGVWGPKTDAASDAWEEAFSAAQAPFYARDARTERLLHGVLPRTQDLARRLLDALGLNNLDARIISGTRSYAEQNALYRQGRFGNPGPTVTNARGGSSNHNFGIAFDVGLFQGGRYLKGNTAKEAAQYDRAGELASTIKGLEWGGNWKSLVDRPHYQVATGLKLSEIRRRFEAGELKL